MPPWWTHKIAKKGVKRMAWETEEVDGGMPRHRMLDYAWRGYLQATPLGDGRH